MQTTSEAVYHVTRSEIWIMTGEDMGAAELLQHPYTLQVARVLFSNIGQIYRTGVKAAPENINREYLQRMLEHVEKANANLGAQEAITPPPMVIAGESPRAQGIQPIAVGCIPCARAHLAGVAADLKEALRFARDSGIDHPEAQTRISTAEEEIVALERHDWTAEKVQASPPEHQEIIRKYLPEIRDLRQVLINEMGDVEDLERVAAAAGEINTKFRIDVLKSMRRSIGGEQGEDQLPVVQ